jgi:uncharacterized membrane protein YfcA
LSSLIPAFAPFLDDRLAIAALIAFTSGVVRGFSGFGQGMIYVPLIAALYGPRLAVTTLLLIDIFCSVPFLFPALPHVRWKQMLPLAAAAALTIPLGTLVLLYMDPSPLRWGIAISIVICVALLASGWRYRGTPGTPVTLGVGAISGILGGAIQIPGPPVILFWLSGTLSAVAVRANFIAYFALFDVFSIAVYGWSGLMTNEVFLFGILMFVPFIAGAAGGAMVFIFMSDSNYRAAAYGLILIAAVLSLPLFDGLLR